MINEHDIISEVVEECRCAGRSDTLKIVTEVFSAWDTLTKNEIELVEWCEFNTYPGQSSSIITNKKCHVSSNFNTFYFQQRNTNCLREAYKQGLIQRTDIL